LKPDTPPIAAASLGQVYKLKLKSDGAKFVEETSDIDWCRCSTHCTVQNDTIVAVKVQRPDMLSFVLRDLFIMRNIAKLVEKVKSTLTKNRPYDVGLLDTFASASLKELDYINEAANQEFFRRELMHRMGSKVP
jgi:predicted unusual protein kinase regulating ubiquinone biosynthesis (AarF/ABC1/UbiB family)